jgi:hypothetical protein
MSAATGGGDCGSGALAAGVAKFVTINLPPGMNVVVKGIVVSLTGGVVAEIGGGKFANGAYTATFGYLFNYLSKPDDFLGPESSSFATQRRADPVYAPGEEPSDAKVWAASAVVIGAPIVAAGAVVAAPVIVENAALIWRIGTTAAKIYDLLTRPLPPTILNEPPPQPPAIIRQVPQAPPKGGVPPLKVN